MTLKDILADMRMVAEGVKTAQSVYNLSRKINVEMPICEEMYHILYQDLAPEVALHRLMTRQLRYELDEEGRLPTAKIDGVLLQNIQRPVCPRR